MGSPGVLTLSAPLRSHLRSFQPPERPVTGRAAHATHGALLRGTEALEDGGVDEAQGVAHPSREPQGAALGGANRERHLRSCIRRRVRASNESQPLPVVRSLGLHPSPNGRRGGGTPRNGAISHRAQRLGPGTQSSRSNKPVIPRAPDWRPHNSGLQSPICSSHVPSTSPLIDQSPVPFPTPSHGL